MHMILLVLGILSVAAGIGMIAFGIADPVFALGNMLNVAATIAIVGGLLLVGLGSVISHLRRIRAAIEAQRVLRGTGAIDLAPARDRVSVPAPDAEVTTNESIPRSMVESAASGAVAAALATSDAVHVPDPKEPGASPEKAQWPRVDPADRVDPTAGAVPASPTTDAAVGEPVPSPEPAQAEPAPVEALASKPEPAVLKSGVIEGMAYTLYSDGSIEAELAQGTMRFGSIPELRAYMRADGANP
jgi:hypothetical protein